jgi:hypothetical protein
MINATLRLECSVRLVVLLLTAVAALGCEERGARRRTWASSVPVEIAVAKSTNTCLRAILERRFGEVRSSGDGYPKLSQFGYTFYFRSPVRYGSREHPWLAAAISQKNGATALEVSDDWIGVALTSQQASALSGALDPVIGDLTARCAVVGLNEKGPSCETFPAGEPCPSLRGP